MLRLQRPTWMSEEQATSGTCQPPTTSYSSYSLLTLPVTLLLTASSSSRALVALTYATHPGAFPDAHDALSPRSPDPPFSSTPLSRTLTYSQHCFSLYHLLPRLLPAEQAVNEQ